MHGHGWSTRHPWTWGCHTELEHTEGAAEAGRPGSIPSGLLLMNQVCLLAHRSRQRTFQVREQNVGGDTSPRQSPFLGGKQTGVAA